MFCQVWKIQLQLNQWVAQVFGGKYQPTKTKHAVVLLLYHILLQDTYTLLLIFISDHVGSKCVLPSESAHLVWLFHWNSWWEWYAGASGPERITNNNNQAYPDGAFIQKYQIEYK